MVTLKRLMNILALSMLFGAVTTPVSVKADMVASALVTGFAIMNVVDGLARSWDIKDTWKTAMKHYKSVKDAVEPSPLEWKYVRPVLGGVAACVTSYMTLKAVYNMLYPSVSPIAPGNNSRV